MFCQSANMISTVILKYLNDKLALALVELNQGDPIAVICRGNAGAQKPDSEIKAYQ